ncbi:MAG: hypothetical protein JO030_01120 [Candidatus Eremiobacteraeota bacterium]|nr:hypothetical protein [Candidatus Eremiobacteraeota bacterium]
MLHSQFSRSTAARFGAAILLGAFLAGCSAASPIAPGAAGGSTGSVVQRTRALADGHGPRSGAPSAQTGGWISPDARRHRKGLIYWGSYDASTITIYSARGVNGKKKGQITTGLSNPERLFVDTARNVYATNIGNNTITAYQPGHTSPFLTISNGVNSPTGLTVDAAGTVYCANVGNDTITVYPKGQTSPSLTIPVSSSPEYLATDASDNLYASIGTAVYEFPPGSTSGKDLGLNAPGPSALEVDKAGNLIVLAGSTVDYFPAGKTQPSKQITVTAGFPFALSLSADEKTLYVSVETGSTFIIQDVSFPNGTAFSNKLTTNGGEWPVAVSPDNALGG